METQKCPMCQKTQNIEEFRRLTGLKNKFNKHCRSCIAPHKARAKANKEFIKGYQKEYQKKYREEHPDYTSKWRKDNAELVREDKNQSYDTNPHFQKKALSRARLRGLIAKGFEFEAFLGCSFVEFKSHIEAKFQPGMTWENYGRERGRWSLDHIVPLDKAPKDFNINHYSNLQPLWVPDNSAKGKKVI